MLKLNSLTPRTLLAFFLPFVFFSNFPIYLALFPLPEIKAAYWKLLFGLATIIICLPEILASKKKLTFLSIPLFKWLIFYAVITIIWYIPTERSVILQQVFGDEVSGILFICMTLFVLAGHEKAQIAARYAILAAVILTVTCNVLEFFNPFLFVHQYSIYSNPGRSAGLFLNANQSGAALAAGLVMTIGLVSRKLRLPYAALVFLGIALTFSRAAIIGFVLVVIAFTITRVLTKKDLLICAIGLITLILTASAISFYIHNYKPDFNDSNLIGRIDWFSNIKTEDDSISQRRFVAEMAWDQFTENPITGNGLGSTFRWSEIVSTHNMYLTYMSDFGITGIFVYPLFILTAVWKARKETLRIAIPFAILMTWQGFFSHNVAQENYYQIAFVLMASMTFLSRESDSAIKTAARAEQTVQGIREAYEK